MRRKWGGGLARQEGHTPVPDYDPICPEDRAVCDVVHALLLHLVGKGQLLVISGASYSNGKLGDSIWESHHKSSAQGTRRANTPPNTPCLPICCRYVV